MSIKIVLVGEAWSEIPLTKGYTALVDLEDAEAAIKEYRSGQYSARG